jgi:hypothetical protein
LLLSVERAHAGRGALTQREFNREKDKILAQP